MKVKLLAAMVLAGALTGCPSSEELDSAHSIHELPPPTIAPASSLTLHSLTGVVPSSPAGRGLSWTLERLNLAPEAATEETVQAAFDPSVLEQAAPRAIADQLRRVGQDRPFAVVGMVEEPTDNRIVAALMARNGYVQATVEVSDSGRMKVLLFEPLEPGDGPGTPLPTGGIPAAPAAAAPAAAAPAAVPAGSGDGSGSAAPVDAAPADGAAAGE